MIHNPCWGMGWGMWFIPVLVILLVYLLVKNNWRIKNGQNNESPAEILKRRYARGEITREQFEEMKKDIF